ncbi:MAG: FAD-binding protein [Deltaproteobacteria bacterium]|nr:FAD-binding protein [Deltaproteobacteria bacterium]
MKQEIRSAIQEIVGKKNYTDQLLDLVSYTYDASDHSTRPEAAVFPESADQVSRILKLANQNRIPIVARGAGTSLTGSVVPVLGGIVLDMCRMNKIIDIRVADRLAVVEPGVVYGELEEALAPYGFFFPPDPASSQVCTLGGNVATNAGGMRGAKYGVTRDYVLGLEVVLADGRIMRTGTRCMKSASGYDLTRLFVGSEGTLGIITEITLKISPRPQAVKTSLAHFASLKDAGESVTDIMRSGIIPSVLEILDENTINVLRDRAGMAIPEIKAMILVETDGYTEAEASFQMEKVTAIFHIHGATLVRTAKTTKETEELWQARKSAGSVAAQLRPNNVSEDVTVPMSKVPELLMQISEIVRRHGLPFVVFGHAGDGNLHPRIMYDKSDPEQVRSLESAVREIFKLTCDLGGTLTGEHGVGLAKAPFMHLEHDSVAMEMMKSLKETFDPNNILNPGKMGL